MPPAAASTVAPSIPLRALDQLWFQVAGTVCNLRCAHCGSAAGRPREDELSSAEALQVVESLARLGTRVVTLSGGEPTLRDDW